MFSSRCLIAAIACFASPGALLPAAEYRGMTAGWPVYANGYYAANYPASYGSAPGYYVARPVVAAGYAPTSANYALRPAGAMYVPARAAYANPNYFAAYGASPVAYRPVVTAGYAPAAPAATYYAPVTANYAPANSYAVTPAGQGSAGSEAAAYYGQPSALNYVPPRFTYRTTYAPVPVYMYRPVTAYNPITAQPVTCLQATTSTCCQPQRTRSWFSWLHPSNWFGSSCGRGCAPAPTTSYCGTAASQCGQPYYPVPATPAITLPPNVIPAVPSTTIPSATIPGTTVPVFPSTTIPPAGTRIPPPPTGAAIPGARTIITPADAPPRLNPGVPVTPLPGSTTPLPSGSLPSTTIPQGGSFPTAPNSFGTGANYAPDIDPYSNSKQPPTDGAAGGSLNSSPNPSIFGSGYRPGQRSGEPSSIPDAGNVIRAPDLAPAMPPSVQTVPDLDAPRPPRPTSSAPQLLNPRDKTATGADPRWAVVPAVWPVKQTGLMAYKTAPVTSHAQAPAATPPAPAAAYHYDDRGWKSAGF